jgi:chorismate synthase
MSRDRVEQVALALVRMDHALPHRAQNADVTTKVPKIAGAVRHITASGNKKPTSKTNLNPAEA